MVDRNSGRSTASNVIYHRDKTHQDNLPAAQRPRVQEAADRRKAMLERAAEIRAEKAA